MLTPRWKQSEWTRFETYGAEAVIPLIWEGNVGEIFTPPLTRFQGQAIDLSTVDDADWDRLFVALRTLLARPAPNKTERLADVRYQTNPYFVGRDRELEQIHDQLHQNPTAVLTQGPVRAISALGGVGKTTLARQYVEKFWRCYPQIFWVDCRLGIENEFARICDLLEPTQRSSTNIVEKAQIALRILTGRDDRLLVIDNAEDEISVQAWIPRTGHCRTLITSRYSAWSAAVESVHLGVLEPEPAQTLLVTRAGRELLTQLDAVEQEACGTLADKLGFLPLALEQAAAYIDQEGTGFGFLDYLRLFDQFTAQLLAEGVLGSTEYPDSVITTWRATTAKLAPGARAILRLCSFLSAAPLPLSVLIEGADVVCSETSVGAGLDIVPRSNYEIWIRQMLKNLRAYSMVESDGLSLTIHRLIQTVERLQLGEMQEAWLNTLNRSLKWINEAAMGNPSDVRSWQILEPLTPHALALLEHAQQAFIFDPSARMTNQFGLLAFTKAQFSQAERLMRQSLAIFEQSYAEDHPDIGTATNNLAQLLKATNRYGEAEPLMRRALAIDKEWYGAEHPAVARDLNNLAQLLLDTNRSLEAEPLMRRALAIDEQASGSEHTDVACDLNNLGQLLVLTNRHTEAEPLIRRALAIDEHAYGLAHPRVACDLNNLAQLLMVTNRLTEAEPLMYRALTIDENSYGPEHPLVATRLSNLAALLQKTNRHEEAELMMRRALLIDEKLFGPQHPKVALRLNNLARQMQITNRLTEAEPLMRRALAIDEQSFGQEHPNIAIRLTNLAALLLETNRLTEAEPLMRRALTIDEQSYGPEHPRVASDLNNLAALLQKTNKLGDAELLLRRAITIDEHSYGLEHPDVAVRLHNLSLLLRATGRPTEAAPLMRRALLIFGRFTADTGHEHPHLREAMGNFSNLLGQLGRDESEILAELQKAADEIGLELVSIA